MKYKNVYKGRRYVPKIVGVWDKTKNTPYESLTVVIFRGDSYTSKRDVPIGVNITDEYYWVCSGNYNAQIENYRQDLRRIEKDKISYSDIVNNLHGGVKKPLSAEQGKVLNNKIKNFNEELEKRIKYTDIVNNLDGGADRPLSAEQGKILNERLSRHFVSVKDYGAKGDGYTDDTVAIQRAIDSKKSVLFEKDCVYVVKNLQLNTSNAKLDGRGSQLKAKNLGDSCIEITYPAKNVTIEDFQFLGVTDAVKGLDGSPIKYSTNPNGAGIKVTGRDIDLKPYDGIEGITIQRCSFLGNFTHSIIATHATNIVVDNNYFTGNCYVPLVGAGGYGVVTQTCFDVKVTNNSFIGQIFDRHAVYVSSISGGIIVGDNRCKDVVIANNIVDWRISEIYTRLSEAFAIRNPVNCYIQNNQIKGGYGAININPSHGHCENVFVLNNIITDTKNRPYPGELGIISCVYGDKGGNFISKNVVIDGNQITSKGNTSTMQAISPANTAQFKIINNTVDVGEFVSGIMLSRSSDGIIANNVLNGNGKARAWIVYSSEINNIDIMFNKVDSFTRFGKKPEIVDGVAITNLRHHFKREFSVEGNGTSAYLLEDEYGLVKSVTNTDYGCDIVFNKNYNLTYMNPLPITSNIPIVMTREIYRNENRYALNLYNIKMENVPLASAKITLKLVCQEI